MLNKCKRRKTKNSILNSKKSRDNLLSIFVSGSYSVSITASVHGYLTPKALLLMDVICAVIIMQ